MMPRRSSRPRTSRRNVYIADYTVNGLWRVYAITSRGELLVLDDDATGDQRYYRDVPEEEIDATVQDFYLLLDLKDPIPSGVVLRPKLRLI